MKEDDVTELFGVVDETTTTKFASRACSVHCISLPVVVDKVVVVFLKFPIIGETLTAHLLLDTKVIPLVIRSDKISRNRTWST